MGSPPPEDVESMRARAEARSMSYSTLRRLHAQGAAGLRAGTWDIIDTELEERRETARQSIAEEIGQKRYPALRFVIVVLKATAVFVFVAALISAVIVWKLPLTREVSRFDQVGFSAIVLVAGFWVAITNWALAEMLAIQIDIEANTRALRHPVRTMAL